MNDLNSLNQQPIFFSETDLNNALAESMRRVYNWMGLGLLCTTAVALVMQLFPALMELIFLTPLIWVFMIGELAMVWGLVARIHKLTPSAALTWFLLYSAVNGITMSFIFIAYELGEIVLAFGSTMALFFTMSMIGYTTRLNLARLGGFLLMGLIGFVIATLVNIFFYPNDTFYWIITYAGIVLFIGLTVYDTQRIKRMTAAALLSGDADDLKRVGVRGALRLYLDFINLFLLILRVVGGRRR